MEYMKITNFLGGIISKFVNKAIEGKIGYRPNIQIKDLSLKTKGEHEEWVEVNATIVMSSEQFEKLIEEVTK